MSNPSVADGERYRLLMAAIDAHASYIKDAMMGKGIDRHLLGLQIVAEVGARAGAVNAHVA
jgi:predicted GNAT family acetyltransferase